MHVSELNNVQTQTRNTLGGTVHKNYNLAQDIHTMIDQLEGYG